ncbi:MAG TPA: ATP-binding protein [Terracidiphilus sp.]|nr:ATP-binding protein [Terracidiphilus sp.]
MLALALVFFSFAVYGGVRAYLTNSMERVLNHTAESIVTDYLVPLENKGQTWFLSEMSESFPTGISDPFVRVSQGGKVLYESGDLRDPLVRVSKLPLPSASTEMNSFHRATAETGQPLMIYDLAYSPPRGTPIVVETGASMEPLFHLLHSLFMILLIATPAILVCAAVGGHLLMAGPLRPVVVLTEQAERIGRKELGERLSIIRSGDELERLSLALNRMIDRLEEALAHNQRFSADASHELRTPLTIIRGELEALLEIPGLLDQATEGISSALEESDRMSRIVDNLMTISRLDGGGERMEMLPIDLTSILNITLDHMSLLADEKQIVMTCEAEAPVCVTGDAMRLKQVIVNLVDNAIKYTLEGGRVLVRLEAQGREAVLTVADTGIGIPAESLPHVFDRFYRTDKARSRELGGTGLGLAIVKAICSAHSGTLSIESAENKGTTLRVQLPLLILSPQEIAELQSRQAPPNNLIRGERSTVSPVKV